MESLHTSKNLKASYYNIKLNYLLFILQVRCFGEKKRYKYSIKVEIKINAFIYWYIMVYNK